MRRSTVLWVAMAGTIGFYGAAAIALGTAPDSADDGRAVVAWFTEHDGNVRLAVWLTAVGLVFFAIYAVHVRAHLPELHRDLFFAGALLLVGETSVQLWILAALARHPFGLDPSTARTLLDVTNYWGPVLTTATVMMLAPLTVVALRDHGLPSWVGYLSVVALVEQIVETVTIFGDRGFTAPGGPMNLVLGAGLTLIALLGAGVAIARSDAMGGQEMRGSGASASMP